MSDLAHPPKPKPTQAEADEFMADALGFGDDGGGPYTGPLDLVSGATVAYSQRQLASAFVGSIIRINNGTAQQNFAAGANHAVDPAAITAFVGAGSAKVATWYDQSGNGKDVAQATTALQPAWAAGLSIG